jgi:hypothetical protein
MNEIVLQFSTTTHWQSGIIRLMTHSPYSHVDAVIPPGLPDIDKLTPKPYGLLGVSDPGGVMIRQAHYQGFKTRRRVTMKTDKADAFIQNMVSQLGKPFDPEALLRVVDLNRQDWRQRDKWFCSELVTWALEEAGFFNYDLAVTKNRVSPADLLLLLNPYIDPNELNTEVID